MFKKSSPKFFDVNDVINLIDIPDKNIEIKHNIKKEEVPIVISEPIKTIEKQNEPVVRKNVNKNYIIEKDYNFKYAGDDIPWIF